MGARGWLKMSNTNEGKNDKQPDWVPWSSYLMLINKWSTKSNSFWYYLWTVGGFFVFLLYLVCLFLSTWHKKKEKSPNQVHSKSFHCGPTDTWSPVKNFELCFWLEKETPIGQKYWTSIEYYKKKAALKGQITQNQNFIYFPLTPFSNLHNHSGLCGCQTEQWTQLLSWMSGYFICFGLVLASPFCDQLYDTAQAPLRLFFFIFIFLPVFVLATWFPFHVT